MRLAAYAFWAAGTVMLGASVNGELGLVFIANLVLIYGGILLSEATRQVGA